MERLLWVGKKRGSGEEELKQNTCANWLAWLQCLPSRSKLADHVLGRTSDVQAACFDFHFSEEQEK